MENAFYISLSRQAVLRRQMDVVANNLANMTTAGFQSDQPLFVQYLNGERRADRIAQTLDYGMTRDTRPGAMIDTGNPLDLAINGPGYFAVQTADGIAYTRNGTLRLNAGGEIVTAEGYPVVGLDQVPIVIPGGAAEIIVTDDGTISADGVPVGRLDVMGFEDEQAMERLGGTLLRTDQAPQPLPGSRIQQGMLENANVNPILELTRMIEIQRAYEQTNRMIEREGEMKQSMIQTLTRQS